MPLGSVIHLVHETTGLPLPNPMLVCLQKNAMEALSQNAALLRRDGERIAIETSAAPMYIDHNDVFGAVMVFQDVRHTRLLTHQLSYQAGLFNRLKFEESLNALLVETANNPKDHALLYLDLDQFKIVNDTSGHVAGDELLKQVVRRLAHRNSRRGHAGTFGRGRVWGAVKKLPAGRRKNAPPDVATDPIDRAMVEAIQQIGKIMKIQTIAEWVENEATLLILREIGMDFVQGSHPHPILPLGPVPLRQIA